MKVTQCQ